MTYAIWKFDLRIVEQQSIDMPKGSRLLHIAEHFGQPRLWALVDTTADKIPRGFVIVGTGHLAPAPDDPFSYVGTFQSQGFIGHVFDAGERPA